MLDSTVVASMHGGGPALSATNRLDMGWACHITTYQRPETLAGTIGSVLAQTRPPYTVLVVDNGSSEATRSVVEGFADDRLLYLASGDNLGSAGGCALGIRWLYDQGFEWMQLIDDDNPPLTADAVERIRALSERHQGDERVGAVGASGQRWDWTRGEYHRLGDAELVGDLDVDIIGGNHLMAVNRAVVREVGGPDAALFFGFWDPLYCLSIRQAGFRLLVDGELMHECRRLARRLDLVTTRTWRPSDPPSGLWRRYYVTRNYIHRMRTHFARPDLARRAAARGVARSATAFGRGPAYGMTYARYTGRGIIDGYRGRLGRNVEPQPKTSKHG